MRESGLFQKVTSHKLCQNANFENGVTAIQMGILHLPLNTLSIYLLPIVNDTSDYYEMHSSHIILRFEENKLKMQVVG